MSFTEKLNENRFRRSLLQILMKVGCIHFTDFYGKDHLDFY